MPEPTGPGQDLACGVDHRQDGGPSGCVRCGWRGVPTYIGGVRQDRCPRCDTAEDYAEHERLRRTEGKARLVQTKPMVYERRAVKVGRNDPCNCGSGRKAKRCCYG